MAINNNVETTYVDNLRYFGITYPSYKHIDLNIITEDALDINNNSHVNSYKAEDMDGSYRVEEHNEPPMTLEIINQIN